MYPSTIHCGRRHRYVLVVQKSRIPKSRDHRDHTYARTSYVKDPSGRGQQGQGGLRRSGRPSTPSPMGTSSSSEDNDILRDIDEIIQADLKKEEEEHSSPSLSSEGASAASSPTPDMNMATFLDRLGLEPRSGPLRPRPLPVVMINGRPATVHRWTIEDILNDPSLCPISWPRNILTVRKTASGGYEPATISTESPTSPGDDEAVKAKDGSATPPSSPKRLESTSSSRSRSPTSPIKREDDSLDKTKNGGKKKNRCEECRKKVGLTGFPCRCGGLFCGMHRDSIQ